VPAQGSTLLAEGVRILERAAGVSGPFVVTDARYFVGPESPPSSLPYLRVVGRWYLRGYFGSDPLFRGRFLLERRAFGSGLVAIAPYDTHGFSSPDWIGFQYDSEDLQARPRPPLPGRWSGNPYDFVDGSGNGPHIPGLPPAVAGCLAGT